MRNRRGVMSSGTISAVCICGCIAALTVQLGVYSLRGAGRARVSLWRSVKARIRKAFRWSNLQNPHLTSMLSWPMPAWGEES